MRELGSGFLENVYKNALYIIMVEKRLNILTEKTFEIEFRGRKIGRYNADLIVDDLVIIEEPIPVISFSRFSGSFDRFSIQNWGPIYFCRYGPPILNRKSVKIIPKIDENYYWDRFN